jgi:hypothetical protein
VASVAAARCGEWISAICTVWEEGERRERDLESAVATTNGRALRASALEATAAERLAAMQDRDLPISLLRTEIESRDHAIREITRRADALESAAGERLAAMVTTDPVIADPSNRDRDLTHKRLDGALAAVAESRS